MNKFWITLLFFCCTDASAQFKKPYFNTLDVKVVCQKQMLSCLKDNNGYLCMEAADTYTKKDAGHGSPSNPVSAPCMALCPYL